MRLAIISFSRAGEELAEEIAGKLANKRTGETGGARWETYVSVKSKQAAHSIQESLSDWTGARFADSQAILFIGACGIAVRAIAPYVQSKTKDPAVLVADDRGNHVISLLSGHLGGANELTIQIAEILGADPVITTATDNHGKLSPDVFAKKNRCVIADMKMAKALAAALLAGEKAGFLCSFPIEESPSGWPQELALKDWDDLQHSEEPGIVISPFIRDSGRFTEELWLIPQAVYMGVGCKKGTAAEKIHAAAEEAIKQAGIDRKAIAGVGTIDLKKEEEGLLAFCRENALPLKIYTAGELSRVEGNFSSSDFVKSVTGVNNVCERSALAAAVEVPEEQCRVKEEKIEEPQLLLRKFCRDGVTIALAMKKWRIRF